MLNLGIVSCLTSQTIQTKLICFSYLANYGKCKLYFILVYLIICICPSFRMENHLLMLPFWEERMKLCRDLENLQPNAKPNPIRKTRMALLTAYMVQTFLAKYLLGSLWDVSLLVPCLMNWKSPLQGIVWSIVCFYPDTN